MLDSISSRFRNIIKKESHNEENPQDFMYHLDYPNSPPSSPPVELKKHSSLRRTLSKKYSSLRRQKSQFSSSQNTLFSSSNKNDTLISTCPHSLNNAPNTSLSSSSVYPSGNTTTSTSRSFLNLNSSVAKSSTELNLPHSNTSYSLKSQSNNHLHSHTPSLSISGSSITNSSCSIEMEKNSPHLSDESTILAQTPNDLSNNNYKYYSQSIISHNKSSIKAQTCNTNNNLYQPYTTPVSLQPLEEDVPAFLEQNDFEQPQVLSQTQSLKQKFTNLSRARSVPKSHSKPLYLQSRSRSLAHKSKPKLQFSQSVQSQLYLPKLKQKNTMDFSNQFASNSYSQLSVTSSLPDAPDFSTKTNNYQNMYLNSNKSLKIIDQNQRVNPYIEPRQGLKKRFYSLQSRSAMFPKRSISEPLPNKSNNTLPLMLDIGSNVNCTQSSLNNTINMNSPTVDQDADADFIAQTILDRVSQKFSTSNVNSSSSSTPNYRQQKERKNQNSNTKNTKNTNNANNTNDCKNNSTSFYDSTTSLISNASTSSIPYTLTSGLQFSGNSSLSTLSPVGSTVNFTSLSLDDWAI